MLCNLLLYDESIFNKSRTTSFLAFNKKIGEVEIFGFASLIFSNERVNTETFCFEVLANKNKNVNRCLKC